MSSAILTFHSIDDSGSVISYPKREFADLVKKLAEGNQRVVPLDEIDRHPGAIALTFDDAFENFYDTALPLLTEHKLPATIFVVSGFTGKDNAWPTQSAGIPILPLMNWSQVREAADAGIQIGAHTVSHPHLSDINAQEAEREIIDSKRQIEDSIGRPVTQFAYPYGDQPTDSRIMESAGFSHAVTTVLRYSEASDDPLRLPRLDTYYERSSSNNLATPHSSKLRITFRIRRQMREARQRMNAVRRFSLAS